MDEKIDRGLLIEEIHVLQLAVANAGGTTLDLSDDDLSKMSLNDLRGTRDRLQRLVRSLGGIRNG